MGIRGWRKLCKERAEWKKITERAKTHSGLLTPVKEEEEYQLMKLTKMFSNVTSSPLCLHIFLHLCFSSCAPALQLILSWILMRDKHINCSLYLLFAQPPEERGFFYGYYISDVNSGCFICIDFTLWSENGGWPWKVWSVTIRKKLFMVYY